MRNRFAFIVGIIVLASPGCMYHGGYYPNGYNNGYYGAGPSVLPPQQPWNAYPSGPPMNQPIYTPGGTGPTPLDGGGTTVPSGGTQPGSSPSTWQTPSTYDTPGGGGNSAPPFNPNPGTSGGSVPNPLDDPNSSRSPGAQRPMLSPTSTSRVSDDVSSPFSQEDSSRLPRNFADENVVEADEAFQTPVRQTSGFGDGDVQQANRTTLPSQASSKMYGHDRQFQWVKGVVEFDEMSRNYVIIYDNNPPPSDQFGGELTLAEHPDLANLRNEDKIRVEGTLDQTVTDSRGFPVFRITRLKKQ